MELLFLNEAFEITSQPIDRYYSLQWAENYYDEGTFELHLASDYFPTVLRSEYVYNNEADEAMLIDDVQASDDGKQTLKLSGKSLDTLLKHRVMDEVDSFTGTVEDIARQAVQKYAIASDRSVSLLRLGTRKGYTDTAVATNERGAELYEWLRELLKPYEMSFRIHYNFEDNALDFEVYRGLDRTQEQTANTWAIFSTSFENLSQFSYARNRSDYRNYAIVMTDDGTKRVTVDKTGGAPRRELFVSADDELDTAAMTQLGESALAEYAMIETVSGEVQGGANMIYGENYALGDLCNIEDTHLGVSAAARLTQMTTVVEKGVTRRVPSFGEQYLSLRQYVAREVRASGGGGGSSGGGVVDLTEIEQAIAANTAAIEDNAESIEAAQAAIYDNAQDISKINVTINDHETRLKKLEESMRELPEGYTRLSYIRSTGSQYIKSGVNISKDNVSKLRIVADIRLVKTSSKWCIDGTGDAAPFVYFGCASSGVIAYGNATGDIQTSITYNENRYVWDYDLRKKVLIVGNNSFTFSVNYTGATSREFYISAYSSPSDVFLHEEYIYGYQFYEDNNIIRDYIPCINQYGQCGLYDKANKQFYGNAGTGSFTGG